MFPAACLPLIALLGAPAPGLGEADQPLPAGAPQVRLVSPGRAPLRPLRYHAQVGHQGQMTMSMTMAMEMSMAGQTMPAMPSPEIRSRYDYKVTEITPAGDVRYTFEFGEPEVVGPSVPPAVLQATRESLKAMRGMRGHAVTTSRGYTREAHVEVPAGASPQMRQLVDSLSQSIRQVAAPFPAEPVGVGATWDTTMRLTQNGITIDQKAHSELTAIEGDKGRLAIILTQSAEPQRMQGPNLPPTARMDLVSLSSAGEGDSHFDLARLVPISARMKMKMEMKSSVRMGEEKPQDMNLKMDMSMTVTGR